MVNAVPHNQEIDGLPCQAGRALLAAGASFAIVATGQLRVVEALSSMVIQHVTYPLDPITVHPIAQVI